MMENLATVQMDDKPLATVDLPVWDALDNALSSSDRDALNVSAWDTLAHALSLSEERPQVVPSVESAQQTTRAGAAYVVIRNPAAHTYLKLDPPEFELMRLMDGARTIRELVIAYYQQNGVLAMSRIIDLVRLLKKNSFLTDPAQDAYTMLGKAIHGRDAAALVLRLVRGFMLTEFPLRNIDACLGAWYRAWGWVFFTRPAGWFGLALTIIGSLFYIAEFSRERYNLFRMGDSYLAGFAVMFGMGMTMLLIHEMGHALAVKHAKRFVPRGGFLLYYGMLAGYVDTTDVWMAPRRMRMMTAFAGMWTGLVLGGACGVAVYLLPEGPLGAFLFLWGFVFLVDNLFNLNPLMELDGYYLLVDLVEKPMLRARALTFVRGPLWKKLLRRARLTGEEYFFALFGLASFAYSLFAIYLAVFAWERRVWKLVEEALTSNNLFAQAGVLILGIGATIPFALGLWGMAKQWIASASQKISWLSRRATVRRHREALEALRAVPLWAKVPEAQLIEVARVMRVENIAIGTEVVRQGEPGDRFYLVAQGVFEVLGDGQPVRRVGRGDYFGERALLTNAPRNATVVAVEPSRVFSLDQTVFHATLAHDLALRARLESALDYRADVAAIPLFRDLSSAELDLLLTRLTPISAAPGQVIFQQGEPGDRFYVIRSGQVEVVRDGELIATRGAREAFGEIALLNDVPRTAMVRAIAPTELLALNATDFRDLLSAYLGRGGELQQLSHQRLQTYRRSDMAL